MQLPLLGTLTGPAPDPQPTELASWWQDHLNATADLERPIDRALAGGFGAYDLQQTFVAGYRAALLRLVPGFDRGEALCLAVTESGGNGPRAIRTTLDGGRLQGKKSFATLACPGRPLLVLARQPHDGPRPRLRLLRLEGTEPGLHFERRPPLPFMPDVWHAKVFLDNVPVATDGVLPGDGWSDYIKPFRSVEDLHVCAAVVGWLVAVGARAGWSQSQREGLMLLAVAARGLASEDPRTPATHVALAGWLTALAERVASLETAWEQVDPDLRALWERDRAVLYVAHQARQARRERAWQRLMG